jgi:hypothetical protein
MPATTFTSLHRNIETNRRIFWDTKSNEMVEIEAAKRGWHPLRYAFACNLFVQEFVVSLRGIHIFLGSALNRRMLRWYRMSARPRGWAREVAGMVVLAFRFPGEFGCYGAVIGFLSVLSLSKIRKPYLIFCASHGA